MTRRLNPEIKRKVREMVSHLLICHNVQPGDQDYELKEIYDSIISLNHKYELFVERRQKRKLTIDNIERLITYKDEYIG